VGRWIEESLLLEHIEINRISVTPDDEVDVLDDEIKAPRLIGRQG